MRARIITVYCQTSSASSGGAYIQQLEALAIMKYKMDQELNFGYISINISQNGLIKEKIHPYGGLEY